MSNPLSQAVEKWLAVNYGVVFTDKRHASLGNKHIHVWSDGVFILMTGEAATAGPVIVRNGDWASVSLSYSDPQFYDKLKECLDRPHKPSEVG